MASQAGLSDFTTGIKGTALVGNTYREGVTAPRIAMPLALLTSIGGAILTQTLITRF